MTFAKKVIAFNKSLGKEIKTPASITVLDPYSSPDTLKISSQFYTKYYSDQKPRIFILGINPGRFGAGVTGVPFTDPINLEEHCGIKNERDKRHELSSIFVYEFINAFGGATKFYKKFFITAVCPLGFTSEGKNINYYDDRKLQNAVEPFIISKMNQQLKFPAYQNVALILGEGKNYKYFSGINNTHNFFDHLVALPHPRFILQYRRKKTSEYVERYLNNLEEALKLVKQ